MNRGGTTLPVRLWIVRAGAALAAGLGVLGLFGWVLGIGTLAGAWPGWVQMRPITSLALILLGLSRWMTLAPQWRRASRLPTALAAAIAALTLAEYVLVVDLGIDFKLAFLHPIAATTALSGRMAANTAVALLILALAQLAEDAAGRWWSWASEAGSVLTGLVAGATLVGVAYGSFPVEGGGHVPMAANTALACAALSLAAVAAHPRSRLAAAFVGRRPGALLARRLVVAEILVVVAIGWLQIRAQRAGVGEQFGEAAQAVAIIVCLGVLVLWSASALDRAEAGRREADEGRRQLEDRLRAEFENAGVGLAYVAPDGRFLQVNRRLAQMLGYSVAELLAKTFQEITHPDHLEQDVAQLARLAAGHADSYVTEKRYLRKDGAPVWVGLTATVVRAPDGTISHVIDAMTEIGDRRQAEDRLRETENEYRLLVEHASIGIFQIAPDGRVLSTNPALVAMLGYGSAAEVLSLDLGRQVYLEAADFAAALVLLDDHDVANTEATWVRKDGTRITVRTRLRAVRDAARQVERLAGLVEDVTQQRTLENQVRQSQRLEAVGRLAGGVAHDFNNVLTAITGYTDLMLQDLPENQPMREDLEEVRAAAERAAALTRQLLAFSRKQVLQARVLDINELVRGVDRMLRRLIGEDVTLSLALAPQVGAVRTDPGQLEQVILNLAVNARDAMPGGGRITIETADVELDASYAQGHPGVVPGPYVMLAMTDTGTGMDPETMSHLFEPFFTTKEQGKGTGLGLATVYGIVRQSEGHIWVYSEPGRGATFKIYLPRVAAAAVREPAAGLPASSRGGTETILLAEDDPAVRAIASGALERKGYRVLRAADGQAALELAGAHDGPVQLLVTDLVMPGMTGRELAEQLTAGHPDVRVLYISGYTTDAVVRHGVLEAGLPYLQKPFSPEALAAKVREVLDRD